MGSEIMNAVTIYEINGMKYTGPRTINVTSHELVRCQRVLLVVDTQSHKAQEPRICARLTALLVSFLRGRTRHWPTVLLIQ